VIAIQLSSLVIIFKRFELISDAPHQSLSDFYKFHVVKQQQRPPLTEIPDESLQNILTKCWIHNPNQRISSTGIFFLLKPVAP